MEVGGDGKGQVKCIESLGRPVTAEDVWNAAIRGGADPARMALSLCHVLGEVTLAEMETGRTDDVVTVRYTLKTGEVIEYGATLRNPFTAMKHK